MRNTLPPMSYVQTKIASIAGHVGVGVEGSNATVPGDDQWHGNSGNDLTVPVMEPYGPSKRYFEVFSRGTNSCTWDAAPEVAWIKLSAASGEIAPTGSDTRVYISIDWDSVPEGTEETFYINVTNSCRSFDKHAYRLPRVLVPVNKRSIPADYEGYVESDGVVAIEGPHYSSVLEGSAEGVEFHTFKNYGRTLSGVGLYPPETEKLEAGEGPALEYSMYLFTNATAKVTLFLSPSHNYLGDGNPLEYAISLAPAGSTVSASDGERVQPVGPTEGTQMPAGWDGAVADAVWGVSGDYTTSEFEVAAAGEYVLRVWPLLPSIIVQKVVVDLGGLRESYLGPPQSFNAGTDEIGTYEGLSFMGSGVAGAAPPMCKKRSLRL